MESASFPTKLDAGPLKSTASKVAEHGSLSENDRAFMRRALSLAHCGRFTASPNPRVGCVIVDESGKRPTIIGEGFHRKKGLPHAEREALDDCAQSPAGATMYVTLEPCCHAGATPPCTDAIVEAGIKKVFAAIVDPFPKVSGKGLQILRDNNIETACGLLEEEAWRENRFFIHRHQTGLPWVILKAAMSLDGKLAASNGTSKWITGAFARNHAHELRAECDAVLAGINTVLADDPQLNVRLEPVRLEAENGIDFHPPARVVYDPECKIPIDSKLVRSAEEIPLILFCHQHANPETMKELRHRGAVIETLKNGKGPAVLREMLKRLADRGILSVMIEGGPKTHTAFLEARLVNELFIYIAPKLIGGQHSPTFFMGNGIASMQDVFTLENVQHLPLGDDLLIRGILSKSLQG